MMRRDAVIFARVMLAVSSLSLAGGLGCAGEDGAAAGPNPGPVSTGAAIGAPCVPTSEQSPDFRGASIDEVSLDFGDQCASGICLIHNFQGRVSCPYGQNETDIESLPADAGTRCRVPNAEGVVTAVPVTVPVLPQVIGRPAAVAVTCSCSCGGAANPADNCTCPDDAVCLHTFSEAGESAPGIYLGLFCVPSAGLYGLATDREPCTLGDPASFGGTSRPRGPSRSTS